MVVNEMIKTVLLVDVLIWYQHKCKAGGGEWLILNIKIWLKANYTYAWCK